MPYAKLSDLVTRVTDPQQTDVFVKLFKAAVREGHIKAMALPQVSFTLPKQFSRRGLSTTYQRTKQEMVYETGEDFEAWFNATLEAMDKSKRRKSKIKPTFEAIEAGDIDFSLFADETRKKLNASYNRGKNLGNKNKK